jgi:quinol monooxygenase YgiN
MQMPVLHIEHEISDLDAWLDAFRKFAPAREAAGVTQTYVYQPTEDPNYIMVNLRFENIDAASNFRDYLIERIWSSQDSAPALVGVPVARVLTEVEL